MISVTEVLSAICDEKSLKLFEAVASKGRNRDDLSTVVRLSRKEYYSRMSHLTRLGIVRRKNGKNYLTAFGKVVHDGHNIIKKASENHYKLIAIDSMELSSDVTKNERSKLIDSLVDDPRIKEILLREL